MARIEIETPVRLKPTNKPADKVTLLIGKGTFILPAIDVVEAVLAHARNGNGSNGAAVAAAAPVTSALPKIGAEWKGGIYAGLTLFRESIVALVLMPGDEKLKWEDAMKWAEKQGGVLPSRIDQLVLFQNVKDQFKQEYYWSAEPFAPDAGYAWLQTFNVGGQGSSHTNDDYRARAVRRIAIQ